MIGETVTGVAGALLPGGQAVVHLNGQTILVANAVSGDELALHVSAKRRGVWRGEIVEVIKPSDARITPSCSVGDQCGGCALQMLSGENQAALKSDWVKEAFASLFCSDSEWIPVTYHDNRYRRRVRWSIGSDREGLFLGFKALASHQVVRHTTCSAVTPELHRLSRLIEANLPLHGLSALHALQLSDGIHIVIESEQRPEPVTISSLDTIVLQWWWRDREGITRPLKKPVIAFHDLLPAGEADVALTVGADSFVQGQMEGNRELIAQIQAWAGKPKRIADLFCGIGNLSLPLAAATGAEVAGAELNAASVRAAQANAKSLAVNARFDVANLFERFDLEPYIGADILLLDPPRRGARRICSQISRLLPEKIIMISCDVAAGARDGALLKQQGYRLKSLRALDLFPGAGHVEAMSYWERV